MNENLNHTKHAVKGRGSTRQELSLSQVFTSIIILISLLAGSAQQALAANETLWGVDTPSAPTCTSATITNLAGSVDQAFNNDGGVCAGFTKNDIWEYASIQDTAFTTITSVTLSARLSVGNGWSNDTIDVSVFDGAAWILVGTISPSTASTFQTYVFDVSVELGTAAKLNAAQVQLRGRQNGQAETYDLSVDEISLDVVGTGGSNNAPVAVSDNYSTDQDTQLSVSAPGVLDNDTDADLDPLNAVLDTDVSNGTLNLQPDGSFTYDPDPGYTGPDSFTYFANDSTTNSASPATVSITVNAAGNSAPDAVNDSYAVDQDTQLSVSAPGVLDNDTDADLDPLNAILDTDVSNGTLNLQPDGSFTYDPNPGYTGLDSFTYFANDSTENSPTAATVSITVNSVNNPPYAYGQKYYVMPDATLSEPAPGVLWNAWDSELDPITAVLDTDVSNGSLSLNSDGSFTYTPNPAFTGTDSFTYYAHDGNQNSVAPLTVEIEVGVLPNPHGGYTATTNDCGRCHRTHTTPGAGLLSSSLAGNEFCYTCHDGTGASSPPFVSTHSNADFVARTEGSFELLCVQCHDPHGHDTNLVAVKSDIQVVNSPLQTTGPVVFTSYTGPDSFDEIDAADVDDLCVACHIDTSNPGYPMVNHAGGDHTVTGWGDQRGNDCTFCHGHDQDNNISTRDGFMPKGCTGCHANPQDNEDGLPATGRMAVVGDFSALSHHVDGTLTDADCQVCHDMTNHMNGYVELINGDNSGTVYVEATPGKYRMSNLDVTANNELTAFCFSCHDGDGAARLGAQAMMPFSGGTNPATANMHSNTGYPDALEEPFTIGCAQCHKSHGSSNLAMIEDFILREIGITTGPVVFTAFTGVDSYDEIDSPENAANNVDDLCTTCHVNYTFTNHFGGDHTISGGLDERGFSCTSCHEHNLDGDAGTDDGFMAAAGASDCMSCHDKPQPDGNPTVRQINGVGGDFERSSHHVTTAITQDDCLACHDHDGHKQGTVNLYNADSPGTIYAMDGINDAADYEAFCLACHDANGAGGAAPFSDGIMPPEINSGSWFSASHYSSSAMYGCIDCHDNGHGSNKNNLLAPWNYSSDGDPDDPMAEEERFCYACHDADGPAVSDVEATFAAITNWSSDWTNSLYPDVGENNLITMNDRHDIAATDQAISGSVIECDDCHDPHTVNDTLKVSADPDPGDGRVPQDAAAAGTDIPGADFWSYWCLDCHDGSLPAGVTDNHQDTGFVVVGLMNIDTTVRSSAHGAGDGRGGALQAGTGYSLGMFVQCLQCHIRHVSDTTPVPGGGDTNLFHLKNPTHDASGINPIPSNAGVGSNNGGTSGMNYELSIVHTFITDDNNGYSWCNTCHDGSSMQSGSANCSSCHVHRTKGKW